MASPCADAVRILIGDSFVAATQFSGVTAVPPAGAEQPSAVASGLIATFVATLPGAISHEKPVAGKLAPAKTRLGT